MDNKFMFLVLGILLISFTSAWSSSTFNKNTEDRKKISRRKLCVKLLLVGLIVCMALILEVLY